MHQYLCFNSEIYKDPTGALYHTHPSLKFDEDRDAMWKALINGPIATTGTDEAFVPKEIKLWGNKIDNTTGSSEGVEARMGIIYSEGVVKRGMSLKRFADVTSTNAAKLLGFYPRKGAIAPGSDADITIFDPSIHKKLQLSDLHGTDYSIWEGWEIFGWPVTTILRGKVMVDKGQFYGEPGYGKLIPRTISSDVLTKPLN